MSAFVIFDAQLQGSSNKELCDNAVQVHYVDFGIQANRKELHRPSRIQIPKPKADTSVLYTKKAEMNQPGSRHCNSIKEDILDCYNECEYEIKFSVMGCLIFVTGYCLGATHVIGLCPHAAKMV